MRIFENTKPVYLYLIGGVLLGLSFMFEDKYPSFGNFIFGVGVVITILAIVKYFRD